MGEGPRPREGAVGGGASLRGDPPRSRGSLAGPHGHERVHVKGPQAQGLCPRGRGGHSRRERGRPSTVSDTGTVMSKRIKHEEPGCSPSAEGT